MRAFTSSWVAAGLLLCCLGSFLWAMLNFFSRPARATNGMKVISACGIAFASLHLGAILLVPRWIPARAIIADSFYICALGLFWWAILINYRQPLSAAFSPDIPVHLMQDGPYRFIRHPFYCSYLLTWAAGVVASGRISLLPTVAVMFIIYLRAARLEEEKFGNSLLGRRYQLYQARTGRFFPNPIKLMAARGSR
jgi:protein-S-isoprenylcysteine O-methyltransferase Ste14